MKTFNFFFGICFDQRHLSLTDSLSKALQIEVSAVSGQHVDSLIQSMRSDSDFDLFYQTVKKQKELII